MSDQPRALRLAECLLRDRDMNWPDYDNMQSAAAELCRLHEVNAELLEALQEAIDLAWIGDSHLVQFDRTVLFSEYYDFSRLEGTDRQEFLGQYDCVVWPGPKWSAYCTYEGATWFERFDTAEEAKEQCMRLLDAVLPDHPAMKARAVIRRALGQ